MGVLEALKKGFRTANANLVLVAGLFVYNVVINLLQLPIQAKFPAQAPGAPPVLPAGPWVGIAFVLWLLVVLIGIFIQGGLLEFTKSAVAKPEPEDTARFWDGGGKHYLKLLGFGVLLFLYLFLFVVVSVIIVTMTGLPLRGVPMARNVVVVLEGVVLAAVGIASLLYLIFSPYAIVVQAQGIMGGIKKSLDFVKANFLKVLGLILLLVAVGVLLGAIVGIVMGVSGAAFAGLPIAARIIGALLGGALNAYILFVGTASLMALYLAPKKEEVPAA